MNTTLSTIPITNTRPLTQHFKAAKIVAKTCFVDTKTGRIYNRHGLEIGEHTYEPRVTVHLDNGKKYNARINKIVAFCVYGPEAFRRGVSVRHKNADKFDNRGSNLELRYDRRALRNLKRLQAARSQAA